MGGNITLKLLGEYSQSLPSKIKAAIAVSVPCDLEAAAKRLGQARNFVYMQRFLSLFKQKMAEKSQKFPDLYSMHGYWKIRNFYAFDSRYTAPIHGFKTAEEYWRQSSSKNYLLSIRIPSLILNALDDAFLAPECFPYQSAKENLNVYLEAPKHGGHVGFLSKANIQEYWSEQRILNFISEFK